MARLLIILILTSLFAFPSCSSDEEPLIAVSVFRSDDAFINDVVDWIASESHDGIPVIVGEAENSQDVQNRMISGFLDEGCSSMIINCVDRTAAGLVIEKCRKADVPLVFLNREPLKEDMAKWDRAYYVGARADVCGEMAGEYMAAYWKSHPEADRNGDGILQFVILRGETGHQDSELRTEYFLKALAENGVRIERLGEGSANWQRGEARALMESFLRADDGIEAVFANNDMMALGAIDALKEAGWFDGGPYMPVIGCDGIDEALEAMEQGYLLYTVINDSENQARAAYRIASLLAEGKIPDSASVGYGIDGRYVWIPYREVSTGSISSSRGSRIVTDVPASSSDSIVTP